LAGNVRTFTVTGCFGVGATRGRESMRRVGIISILVDAIS
jgi:hypothetical protein